MPRPMLPDNERLVLQGLRISPAAKQRLNSLPPKEKKRVIAEMRRAAEMVIIAMTTNGLKLSAQNNSN